MAKANLARVLDDRLSCSASDLSDLAREILSSSRETSTIQTYQREWSRFTAWAKANHSPGYPVTPEECAAYLTWLHSEGYGRSTIRKTITVMSLAHDVQDNPCDDRIVRQLIKGILRRQRPTKKARALSLAELTAICEKLTEAARGVAGRIAPDRKALRNRALISVGWMGALRASELVALDWNDVTDAEQGLELEIRRSKTNKTDNPEIIALPLLSNEYHAVCPVRNLRALRPDAEKNSPVFFGDGDRLSRRSVSRIIERSAELARLEGHFSSHCLRRGFATFAAARGITELQLMRHGRWKSSVVASGYVERSKLWTENPLTILLG